MIPKILDDLGYLFGSRAYKVSTIDSNYDYYVYDTDFKKIHRELVNNNFLWLMHSYFPNSFMYKKDKIKINIVVVPYDQIEIWHLTNRFMKTLPIHLLHNASFRKAMYGDLLKSLTKNIKDFV